MRLPAERAEEGRASLLELCPEGFEEETTAGELVLVAYVSAEREGQIRAEFGAAESAEIDAGWETAWRMFHRPARVGPLWLGPPWEAVDPGSVPVVIDPGQAFGTGSHATTRLCLELLLGQKPTSVVDVGCGSGVLSIAAAKLGFGPVVALDREREAVAAARENAVANDVAIDVRLGDALVDPIPASGLVLANLERGLVESVASRIQSPLLVASGYLAVDLIALSGWSCLDRRELDGWAAELYGR